jgi:hypothetical protein
LYSLDRACLLHRGSQPGGAFPKAAGAVSNARRRKGALEMQANQPSVTVTLPEVANCHRAVLFIHPLRIASR